jgi:hypothetical protein
VDQVAILRETWWVLDQHERKSRLRYVLSIAFNGVWEALATLGARHSDEGPARGNVPLRAEWNRVTLIPRDASRSCLSPIRAELIGRNRRLGEALWRVVPRRVVVPAAALGLVRGTNRPDHAEFRARRSEIVRRYDSLMAQAPGYASLGVARVFLQP